MRHTARALTRRAVVIAAAGLLLGLAATAQSPAAPPPVPDSLPDVSVDDSQFTPDPVADGTPQLPGGDVQAKKRALAGRGATTAVLPTYHKDGHTPKEMGTAALPYHDRGAPLVDPGLHDAQGVRLFRFYDRNWDHPVAQAQWGLRNLTSYRSTGRQEYLDRAIANAQRNIDRRVESRGAWWYPYDFDLTRCPGRPLIRAPWFSAMAQGQLLSLFVRLFEVTGDLDWKAAADTTFLSLTLEPSTTVPWSSWVDSEGWLWLEEYPTTASTAGERVLNGHIFAMYGIHDYWRITGDSQAADMFDGAASTVRRYLPSHFRVPQWASRYSFGCATPHLQYHQTHTSQFLKLYEMTHSSVFATNAHLLRSDYPAPAVNGTVRFYAGVHRGYKFSTSGATTGHKDLRLSAISSAHADQRIRVQGRGHYYRITNGAFAGYLLPEEYGQRILLGKAVEHTYGPNRTLFLQPRGYTGYAYDGGGNVTGSKSLTFLALSSAPLGSTAWVNGRLSYRVTAGTYLGYWLPHTTGLSFR